jgi:beta-catenin-like protein 1
MLDRKSKSLKDIIGTLQVYHDNVDDEASIGTDSVAMDADGKESERAPLQREILKELMAYLEGC